jgi:hypothetical protein
MLWPTGPNHLDRVWAGYPSRYLIADLPDIVSIPINMKSQGFIGQTFTLPL